MRAWPTWYRRGIAASRMTAVGYGEKYPIGDNSKEEEELRAGGQR